MERFWKHRAADLGHRGAQAQEVIERERRLAQQQKANALVVLVLLGLVLGAGGSDYTPDGPRFLDPSDPMQVWGMDIITRMK